MQEMQSPSGELNREFFAHPSKEELLRQMDARRAEMEKQGFRFVRRVKVGRNDKCPCNSGLKFKRCCISKMGGAVTDQYERMQPTGSPPL